MQSQNFKFGELFADLPSFDNPGLKVANNILFYDLAYKPFQALSVSGDAITDIPQGAFAGQDSSAVTVVFAGDETNLYKRNGTAWDDRSGATYATAADQIWDFAQFDDTLIATNFNDNIQSIDVDSAGNFADLGGSPPKAKYLARVNNFLMLGHINDTQVRPFRVRWSAIGDVADYPVIDSTDAADKQSDQEDLAADNGEILAVVGGDEFGLIFQTSGITRLQYIGGSAIFQRNDYETSIGLVGPKSWAKVGGIVYFLSKDGFNATDGNSVTPIGDGKIDRTVLDDLDDNNVHRVTTGVDLVKKLIYFSYPGAGAVDGQPNKLAVFNYVSNRWTTGDQIVELVFTGLSLGETLETLDNISASIDALDTSLDSYIWTGGAAIVQGFDSAKKLGDFSGAVQTSVIETGEINLNSGGRAMVFGARPHITGATQASVTVKHMIRDLQDESQTTSSAITLTTRTGQADFRADAFYHALEITNTATFTQAIGFDFKFRPSGNMNG